MSRYLLAHAKRIVAGAVVTSVCLLVTPHGSHAAPSPNKAAISLPRILTQIMPALERRAQATWAKQAQAHRYQNDIPLDQALLVARAAMRAGEPTRAKYLAERVIDAVKQGEPADIHALDQAGYASWVAKDFTRAIRHLEAAEKRVENDPLSPWRRAWLADAHMHLGDQEAAIAWAQQARDISAHYLPLHQANAAEARARATHPSAPHPQALADFLQTYPEYPEWRDAHAELAQAWLQIGAFDKAAQAFDEAFQEYPWAPQARHLQRVLERTPELQAHMPIHDAASQLERARIWRSLRQWDTVEALLETLETQALENNALDFLGEVRFERAMNAMEIGDYTLADERFRQLKQSDWRGIEPWEGLRYHGWNLARLGRNDEALEVLLSSAEAQGGQAAQDAVFEYLYDLGVYKEAIEAHPHVSRSERLDAFRFTMMHYLAGDKTRSLEEWTAMARRVTGHDRLQANYWAGRAALHLGRVEQARTLWQAIVDQNPVDYYGLLASSRLLDLDAADVHFTEAPNSIRLRHLPGRVHWNGPDDPHPADFDVVKSRTSSIQAYDQSLEEPVNLDELVNDWAHLFPDLRRIRELARIGADEDARQIYRRMVQEIRQLRTSGRKPTSNTPIALSGDLWAHRIDNRRGDAKRGWWGIPLHTPAHEVPADSDARRTLAQRQIDTLDAGDGLIEAFIDIGRHLEAHYVVRQLVLKERGLQGIPPTSGERKDWFEAYPRPFPSTVLTHTRRANLNPYLLWATIIVESAMNPDAISHASAYGLTQVIPKTGDRLAWELGDTTFGIHSLLDPHVSIRYGAWYLGKLTHKFENQESLALVGYNAGPHRVARWMDWRGAELDADEFIEMVPFRGARNYHKQILRYMASYQRLYEGSQRIYIGLDLLMDYDEAINF